MRRYISAQMKAAKYTGVEENVRVEGRKTKFVPSTSEVSSIPEGIVTVVTDQRLTAKERNRLRKSSINQGNLRIFVRKLGQHSHHS